MKYCVNFSKSFNYLNQVDELRIVINKNTKQNPLPFMAEYSDKRIIICAEEMSDYLVKCLAGARKEHPEFNFTVAINLKDRMFIENLQKNNIPFFFNTKVTDWDTLQGFLSFGVSDMYIAENLGFELDKVAAILHKSGVQVRVFPNVAQSAYDNTPSLKQFFIRPDDISTYEPFVDVCEFYGNKNQISTYYKIYAIDKKWFGPLKEIIIGFNHDLDSRFVLPPFAQRRIKCGKKCFKGEPCNICDRIASAAKTLENNGLLVKIP